MKLFPKNFSSLFLLSQVTKEIHPPEGKTKRQSIPDYKTLPPSQREYLTNNDHRNDQQGPYI
jgi:hypothetical protein